MRVGAVWAGADDDEGDLGMPFGDNGFGDVGGDVGFGAPRHEELRHPGVDTVDRLTGLAQRLDLSGVLDHPQRAQHIGGHHGHHAERLGHGQQMQRGHRVGDRDRERRRFPSDRERRRFPSDRERRRASPQRRRHQCVGVVAVDPVAQRDSQLTDRRFLHRGKLQPGNDHRRIAGRRHDQGGEPLERLGP